MTITNRVQGAFFENEAEDANLKLIRLAPNAPPSKGPTRRQGVPWTHDEHERFLEAMEKYPSGPWKRIANHVGTRSTRQTMTHAQKYRQKIARWKRAGQTDSSPSAQPQSPSDHIDTTVGEDLLSEDSEIWQAILSLDFDLSDEEQQFPDSLAALLEDYEPLQLEMTDIDEQLAQFI